MIMVRVTVRVRVRVRAMATIRVRVMATIRVRARTSPDRLEVCLRVTIRVTGFSSGIIIKNCNCLTRRS